MGKVKIKKKETRIDMTAMSDVTVLLLTFFMLTSTFLQKEPVQVITPPSVSEKKVPDSKLMSVLVAQDGKIFLELLGTKDSTLKSEDLREEALKKAVAAYNETHTNKVSLQPKHVEAFRKQLIVTLIGIQTLIRIPDVRKPCAVLGINVLTDRMQDPVVAVLNGTRTVNDVISASVYGKSHRRVGNARLVVGMGILVHIVIHRIDRFFSAVIAQQLDKTVGNQNRHDPLVQKLIDCERNAQLLQSRSFGVTEYIPFHHLHSEFLFRVFALIL